MIGEALASIALVRPRVIAINGGDGTVQAALTELYNGHHFPPGQVPPVAVLPTGWWQPAAQVDIRMG